MRDRFQAEVTVADAGANLGWPRLEGTLCAAAEEAESLTPDAREGYGSIYDSPCTDIRHLTAPIVSYATGRQGNCATIGGVVYRGAALPWLTGTYVFGDYCSGRIWALDGDVDTGWSMTLIVQAEPYNSSLGVDENGELLVLALGGRIYRLVEADDDVASSVTHQPLTRFIGARWLASLRP